MQMLKVGEITAISNEGEQGSEVLFFKRNEGLLARIVVPERGQLLQNRLETSMERIVRQSA